MCAIVRDQENRSPPSDFRAGWLAVCGRSDHVAGRGDGKLLCLAAAVTKNRRAGRTDTLARCSTSTNLSTTLR